MNTVATGDARRLHLQNINIDFDQWLQLDEQWCNMFQEISLSVISSFIHFCIKNQGGAKTFISVLKQHLTVTGSIGEFSALCRCLVSESIDVELDNIYLFGKIDENLAPAILCSVESYPGFFRVKPLVFDYVFPFWKNNQTISKLCPLSQDLSKVSDTFLKIWDKANEFVPTVELKNFCSYLVTQGNDNFEKYVTCNGPSSATDEKLNSHLTKMILTATTLFPGMKAKRFHSISINDIIKDTDEKEPDITEDLQSLYHKAFPAFGDNINTEFLQKLMAKLKNEANEMAFLVVMKSIGHIPYADIREFGHCYYDHVPSIHLAFWPSIANSWVQKDSRYWPDSDIVQKIILEGCHIVPKSPHGRHNNEWRISFSTAEITLSKTFTLFQQKCYLVAKTVYYVTIKSIDPDVFGSYFIKTVMMKLMEKSPKSFWDNSSLSEVIKVLFENLSSSFEEKRLGSFFIDEMNLLQGISSEKLEIAAIEAAAVAEFPLAFLPNDYNERIKLIKKVISFGRKICSSVEIINSFLPFLKLNLDALTRIIRYKGL